MTVETPHPPAVGRGKAQVELPAKLVPVFAPPRGAVRYRGAYGGRGSAKTRSFALMTALHAYKLAEEGESGIVLCAREFQNSLAESSMEEVKLAIRSLPWLEEYFEIGERFIRTRDGRVRYVFAGLRHNLDSIKSMARILLCWIDEAEPVSEPAYRTLIPTIREEGSELWVTWNPETQDSATDRRFRQHPPRNARIVELNWDDNPWFPATLDEERRRDRELLDPATYAWIWEGAYLELSDAQVLGGKVRVAEFEPDWERWGGPYHGLDYGFAQDPSAAVRAWVNDRVLYVDAEAGGVGIELDDLPGRIKAAMPGAERYPIRADAARPESTSHLRRHGLPRAMSAPKWQGSIEDGVQHLKRYREIVVHPRCKELIRETRLYSYKVDRHTGDVLPQIVDAHNHYIDALRYALAPIIRARGANIGDWL